MGVMGRREEIKKRRQERVLREVKSAEEAEEARQSGSDDVTSLFAVMQENPPPKWMLLELNMKSTLSAVRICADFMARDENVPAEKRQRFQLLYTRIIEAEEECWNV